MIDLMIPIPISLHIHGMNYSFCVRQTILSTSTLVRMYGPLSSINMLSFQYIVVLRHIYDRTCYRRICCGSTN